MGSATLSAPCTAQLVTYLCCDIIQARASASFVSSLFFIVQPSATGRVVIVAQGCKCRCCTPTRVDVQSHGKVDGDYRR